MFNVHSRIVDTGMYVPDKILTNDDLEKMVDTSDEWIYSRTGIKERRISSFATSILGLKAVNDLLTKIDKNPLDIDLIVFCTISPDNNTPSCSCLVQKHIGAKNATAFDINAACTGFIYGLVLADSLIKTGKYKNAIVIGSEVLSKLINWKDRNTCVLFGDGAGAVFIEATSDINTGIIDTYTRSIGEKSDSLISRSIPVSNFMVENTEEIHPYIEMDGREVFKFAVSSIVESIEKLLKDNKLSINDIKCIVPHQANIRIIEAAAQKLKISVEKFFTNLHKYGNTSAASIPIALDEVNRSGNCKKGDLVILVGFGGGLTYGSILVRW